MLIRRAERFTYSDVTPYPAYLDLDARARAA